MNGDQSVKEKYGDFCLTPPVQPVYAGYLAFNLVVVSLIDYPDKSDEVSKSLSAVLLVRLLCHCQQ